MKDDDVSTLGVGSQDLELVAEMVVDTENSATEFLPKKHVVDITAPAPDLKDSLKSMGETMVKLNLGSTASGVTALKPPSCPRVWLPLRPPLAEAAPAEEIVIVGERIMEDLWWGNKEPNLCPECSFADGTCAEGRQELGGATGGGGDEVLRHRDHPGSLLWKSGEGLRCDQGPHVAAS